MRATSQFLESRATPIRKPRIVERNVNPISVQASPAVKAQPKESNAPIWLFRMWSGVFLGSPLRRPLS